MSTETTPASRPCPVCGKPQSRDFRPFCSRGCRDRDLIAWFGEDYRIAGAPVDPDADPDAVAPTQE